MRKIVAQSKNELLRKISAADEHVIKFKLNPEKKSHLEDIVSKRRAKVVNVLREWIRKDKSFLTKTKK